MQIGTHWRSIIQIVHGTKDISSSPFGNVAQEVSNRVLGISPDMIHVFLNSL